MDDSHQHLTPYVVPAISAAGGAARRMNEYVNGRAPYKSMSIMFADIFARMFIAVFVGFCAVWICELLSPKMGDNIRYLSAALGGWTGGELMGAISQWWVRKMGLDKKDGDPPGKP